MKSCYTFHIGRYTYFVNIAAFKTHMRDWKGGHVQTRPFWLSVRRAICPVLFHRLRR